MSDLNSRVLENGLLLKDIPLEQRTELICVQAMKWAINSKNQNNGIYILELIPKDVLMFAFVRANFNHFN
jgi:hypothetical protein